MLSQCRVDPLLLLDRRADVEGLAPFPGRGAHQRPGCGVAGQRKKGVREGRSVSRGHQQPSDTLLDRLNSHAETNTAIVKKTPVKRRLPPMA